MGLCGLKKLKKEGRLVGSREKDKKYLSPLRSQASLCC
jgi:hypothetical protein